jgi:hypothetical protein
MGFLLCFLCVSYTIPGIFFKNEFDCYKVTTTVGPAVPTSNFTSLSNNIYFLVTIACSLQ